jgi:hypothetical protein
LPNGVFHSFVVAIIFLAAAAVLLLLSLSLPFNLHYVYILVLKRLVCRVKKQGTIEKQRSYLFVSKSLPSFNLFSLRIHTMSHSTGLPMYEPVVGVRSTIRVFTID